VGNKGWLGNQRQQADAFEDDCRVHADCPVNRLLRQVANNTAIVAGLVPLGLESLAHLSDEQQEAEESRQNGQSAYYFVTTH